MKKMFLMSILFWLTGCYHEQFDIKIGDKVLIKSEKYIKFPEFNCAGRVVRIENNHGTVSPVRCDDGLIVDNIQVHLRYLTKVEK